MQRSFSLLLFGSVIIFTILYQQPNWLKAGKHSSKDKTLLSQSFALSHLAQALDNGSTLTAGELFAHADSLRFHEAPNPSLLLKSMQQENEMRLSDASFLQGKKISILSYNVGLLDVELFGEIDYAKTPYLDERRRQLPTLIFEKNKDIVLLQEVWKSEDVQYFTKIASEKGYVSFNGPRENYNDGLMSFVRNELLGSDFDFDAEPFVAQNPFEFFPGPQVLRGFHKITAHHPKIGTLHIYNTHLLAWPQEWNIRMEQAREIALYATNNSKPNELIFIAGDMNSGPYYKNDYWKMPDQTLVYDWWKNAISYSIFLHYGDLKDLVVMGRQKNEANSDVELANTFTGNNSTWCKQTSAIVFTATDCNALYQQQYKGTEYPARLDQIFARDPQARIAVQKSGLIFTEKFAFTPKLEIEPSDHYGVFVELLIKGLDNTSLKMCYL